tara:strand:+ start:190 stop:492 length:303 start_codon:yes stop_codon:yes gene_type:complete
MSIKLILKETPLHPQEYPEGTTDPSNRNGTSFSPLGSQIPKGISLDQPNQQHQQPERLDLHSLNPEGGSIFPLDLGNIRYINHPVGFHTTSNFQIDNWCT